MKKTLENFPHFDIGHHDLQHQRARALDSAINPATESMHTIKKFQDILDDVPMKTSMYIQAITKHLQDQEMLYFHVNFIVEHIPAIFTLFHLVSVGEMKSMNRAKASNCALMPRFAVAQMFSNDPRRIYIDVVVLRVYWSSL